MGSIEEQISSIDTSRKRGVERCPSNIVDIRSDAAGIELKSLITAGLSARDGEEKTLPTMLLYDDKGLKLFEDITYLDEYYLTGHEIQVLEKHADQIASRIPEGSMIVELGSGNLRKIKILLNALERAGKKATYYALDLMQSELERTLAAVPEGTFQHVQCFGLWGTYDDGLAWLKHPEHAPKPKVILSMGSSVGNFTRREASDFLMHFVDALEPADMLLIGLDACQEPDKVFRAYNDRHGITHSFTLNGLAHANRLLGSEVFRTGEWEAVGEYDQVGGRHRAFVSPTSNAVVNGVSVKQGERVRIEESYKYNDTQAAELWASAGVIEANAWTNDVANYGLHLLRKPANMFAPKPEHYAAAPVPSLEEWTILWSFWDKVTRQMIPDEELLEKPIKLRNACIFYLGHIPTFFDMKLVEATGLAPTEPSSFYNIFERGIDPDVDDPTKCHAHSEIPNDWPALDVILQFQKDVRQRVRDLYKYGQAYTDAWTGRALWLGFEHEVMHLETLLYMLIQSEKTLPPCDTQKPDFEKLAADAHANAVPNHWFDIPEQTITIGLDDADTGDGPERHFGWDVEKPSYTVRVPALKAQARPITNGEYAKYLSDTNRTSIPASWILSHETDDVNGVNGHMNGDAKFYEFIRGKAVRTVYGQVPLKFALDWPVAASFDELQGCAQYMGGRIPTMEEARSIYDYATILRKREADKALGKTIPAVNSHLLNEGVQESPPLTHSLLTRLASTNAVQDPSELYADLSQANVGFKNWHPVPVTHLGDTLLGQAEMGGVWEWTSSVLTKREGFEAMKLYPAYSADFFDGKHNIVLGGSWATHPRFAGRKTSVNWYQRNYPFVWAGARLVKDA